MFLVSLVFASPLPVNARDTITQGNLALVQALISPERPYVDHPLWKEAIAFGQMAKQQAPAHPEPYGYLAKVYSYLGWYERAWVNYQSFQALGGDLNVEQQAQMVELSKTLGYSLMIQGLHQEAHNYYLLGYSYAPKDPEIALQLARSYLAIEKPDLAQVYLRQLEAREPGSEYGSYLELAQDQNNYGQTASVAFQQGVRHYYQGNLEAALGAFKQALTANPAYAKAYIWAGRMNLELGRPSESLPYWQEASRLSPHDAGVNYFLNQTQNQLRWGPQAYNAFQQGLSFNEQGHTAQAEQAFQQAVTYNPGYSEAWAHLGYIAQQQRAYQKAIRALSEACRLDPANQDYQRAYQEISQKLESQNTAQAKPITTRMTQANVEPVVLASTIPMIVSSPPVQATQSRKAQLTEAVVSGRSAEMAILPYLDLGLVTGGPAFNLLQAQHDYTMLSPTNQSAITFFSSSKDLRGNWLLPINYANGTVHQRLEVLSKPTDELLYYQLCLVPNDDISIKPACSRASGLTITKEGIYEFTQPLSSFYEYYNIDWSRGIGSLMVILRDKEGHTIDLLSAEAKEQSLESYFPMRVNYKVVLVPSGSVFAGW